MRHRLITTAPLMWILAASLLAGCATTTPSIDLPPNAEQRRIEILYQDILALGDRIAPEEARRAARIAIRYSQDLAHQYQVTDSAILHNLKVNLGTKPRGLCIDWTEDLMKRLRQEQFKSMDLHWAIANYETPFRLEHSTVIISARGETLYQGLVLDPWRYSGYLFWSPTREDRDYPWEPRADIMALKRIHEDNTGNRNFVR